MPIIRRARQNDQITVERGANLMASLQDAGIPVASSCGGAAVCTKCVLRVVDGAENLNPPNEEELFLIEKDSLPTGVRVSCQCEVQGDITVDATYW